MALDKKVFYGHLLLTFIIMGACWGFCIILGANGLTTNNQKWIYIPWFLGGISPAMASYIILKKNKKISGFTDWTKHVFDFKHNIWSYLLAIVFPILQMIMMCLISGYKEGLPLYYLHINNCCNMVAMALTVILYPRSKPIPKEFFGIWDNNSRVVFYALHY